MADTPALGRVGREDGSVKERGERTGAVDDLRGTARNQDILMAGSYSIRILTRRAEQDPASIINVELQTLPCLVK